MSKSNDTRSIFNRSFSSNAMTLINGFSFSTRALAVVAFGNLLGLRYKEFGVGYEFQLGQNRQFQ
jgi:hypothetical protein